MVGEGPQELAQPFHGAACGQLELRGSGLPLLLRFLRHGVLQAPCLAFPDPKALLQHVVRVVEHGRSRDAANDGARTGKDLDDVRRRVVGAPRLLRAAIAGLCCNRLGLPLHGSDHDLREKPTFASLRHREGHLVNGLGSPGQVAPQRGLSQAGARRPRGRVGRARGPVGSGEMPPGHQPMRVVVVQPPHGRGVVVDGQQDRQEAPPVTGPAALHDLPDSAGRWRHGAD
mmetsp:Transcript_81731/g.216879  ORF Transcript_81731/g.216879 Transcript_81731/m.216879 type:complete len:229 (-) Transcript_81731:285-971(-)